MAGALAQTAHAADGWYIGLEAGGTLLEDADNRSETDPTAMAGTPPGGLLVIPGVLILVPDAGMDPSITPGEEVRYESEFDGGYNVGLTFGYAMPGGLRPEVELKYRENQYEALNLQRGFGGANGERVDAEGSKDSASLMTNLWFDFLKGSTLVPYVGAGIGASRVNIEDLGVAGQGSISDHDVVFAYQAGLGVSSWLTPLLSLSLDYRYLATDDPEFQSSENPVDSEYGSHNVSVGLRYVTSPIAEPDADGDGVPDRLDRCPNTESGVSVNEQGCPIDSDGDGVPDLRDKCPNTPAGTSVGPDGCPLDSDGDGVPDSQDQCPATPEGLLVNASGCALDEDNDGVPTGARLDSGAGTGASAGASGSDSSGDAAASSGTGSGGSGSGTGGATLGADTGLYQGIPYRVIDQCPNTPPGVPVNAIGCSDNDSDGDGIPDNLDLCPATPPSVPVMRNGCGVNQAAILQGVNYEFDSDRLTLNAERVLDTVAKTLEQSPGFGIAIIGHTDSLGSDAYNQDLSSRRAASAKRYLVSKGIDPGRIATEGAGESEPIADNGTDAGRAKNRRIELTVTSSGQ